MSKTKLHIDTDFLVKESKAINFIAGGILIVVFAVSLISGDYGWWYYLFALGLFLIPGAIAIAKGRRNTTIMKINKTGFYYGGKLVTNWNLFCDASLEDQTAAGSHRDNFVLRLRYYSSDRSLLYTKIIPLTNTQDKAEEEIIEAIRFYYNGSQTSNSKQISS